MNSNKEKTKYESVRLVFQGLVGLVIDPTQIDPAHLRIFVTVTPSDQTCRKSRCSHPIKLSQTNQSFSSHERRYVAIWQGDDNGILLNVKPKEILLLQICVQFASGSNLALGYCKWRSARKGNVDLIIKHYKQEGAAIQIDAKGDAMLRFTSAVEVDASYSSSLSVGQKPVLLPSFKDKSSSMRDSRRNANRTPLDHDDEDDSTSTLCDTTVTGNLQTRPRLHSDSSSITIRHKNTSRFSETNRKEDSSSFTGDHCEWNSFDTPECFRDPQHSQSWFRMTQKSKFRGIDNDQDEKIHLAPRSPRNSGSKGSIVVFDFPSHSEIDVLGTPRCEDLDSTSVSSDSDEGKEADHLKRDAWNNNARGVYGNLLIGK
ncbi:hypothetical protein FisN_27Hu086 [Fistulifera solaris]|uniref:Uncharacterized protein n=1 Tax=Fistulifera solaris TaxID=1519565 RepID=A0A1Z5KPM3_FISSO|nr:hypothetical protein FisN_27Hu086 [Fistulifera solaris]|eukprot:GAX28263.1 hypothetical protein FisN_27Hu086 [Fistulifera solaris]